MRRPKIVIFEGPDGAGKSTAAKLRAQDEQAHWNPATVIHNGPPKQKTGRELYKEYLNQLELAVLYRVHGVSTIIDRSFVSEVVYGPVFRGASLLSKRQVRKLEKFCTKHDIERIGIDTELWIRIQRIEDRGEPYDSNQARIGHAYHTYFQANPAWAIVSGQLTHTE